MITKIHKVTAWQTQDGSLFTDKEKAIQYDVDYSVELERKEKQTKNNKNNLNII